MDEAYKSLCRHVFDPILDRFSVPQENRKYIMKFYINGLVAVIGAWVQKDCEEPIEKIVSVIRIRIGSELFAAGLKENGGCQG